jgi:uncharacterized protein
VKPFKPQLALITGATSGLGKSLAYLLAEQSAALIITGRDKDRLHQVTSSLQKKTDVISVAADLSMPNDLEKLCTMIRDHAPDLVINCAGYATYGKALERQVQEEMRVFQLNSSIPIQITMESAKSLYTQQKQGTILNVCSVASSFVFPYLAMYAAAKAALLHFSKSFHEEMAPFGISILAACPGKIDTPFIQKASNKKNVDRKSFAMSQEFAAKRILKQLKKKRPVVDTFDWTYRLYSGLTKIIPEKVFLYFLKKEMENLHHPQPFETHK